MNKEPMLSNCCKAPMRAVFGDEGTNHFECFKCEKACDIYQPDNKQFLYHLPPEPKGIEWRKNLHKAIRFGMNLGNTKPIPGIIIECLDAAYLAGLETNRHNYSDGFQAEAETEKRRILEKVDGILKRIKNLEEYG